MASLILPFDKCSRALGHARHFVHFVTYGISDFFVGALKIVAQRVPVRGVVANVDERMLDEFTLLKNEAPSGYFDIIPLLRGEPWEDFPHHNLLVVDGLLAFKGSANLTVNGWRKAAIGLDHIEAVTLL